MPGKMVFRRDDKTHTPTPWSTSSGFLYRLKRSFKRQASKHQAPRGQQPHNPSAFPWVGVDLRSISHHDVSVSFPGAEHFQLLELVHAVGEETRCKLDNGGWRRAGDGEAHKTSIRTALTGPCPGDVRLAGGLRFNTAFHLADRAYVTWLVAQRETSAR